MATIDIANLIAFLQSSERISDAVPSAEDQIVEHASLDRVKTLIPASATFPTLVAAMREYTFDVTGTLTIDLTDCPATQANENHTGRKLLAHLFTTGAGNVGNVVLDGSGANGYSYLNDGEPVTLPPFAAEVIWSELGLAAVASNKKLLVFTGSLNDTFKWLAVFGTPAA